VSASAVPARGVRRVELGAADPEPVSDFYAALLGWVVIAEPDGGFTGWVGDRLAVRVRPGDDGFRVVFSGAQALDLGGGAALDRGRVLHGPWAPEPRPGEPCWVEFTGDALPWAGRVGWRARTPDEAFTVYDHDDRAVAGRSAGEGRRWTCYFSVPDVAAAVDEAVSMGAAVVTGPADVAAGFTASLADPSGAVFALLQDPPGWGGTWVKA
jgi:uncharacterized protein